MQTQHLPREGRREEGGGTRQELSRTLSNFILETPSLIPPMRGAKLESRYKESCSQVSPEPCHSFPKVTLVIRLKLSAEGNLSLSLLHLRGAGEISPDTACSQGPELSAFFIHSVNKVTSRYPLAPSKLGQLLNV